MAVRPGVGGGVPLGSHTHSPAAGKATLDLVRQTSRGGGTAPDELRPTLASARQYVEDDGELSPGVVVLGRTHTQSNAFGQPHGGVRGPPGTGPAPRSSLPVTLGRGNVRGVTGFLAGPSLDSSTIADTYSHTPSHAGGRLAGADSFLASPGRGGGITMRPDIHSGGAPGAALGIHAARAGDTSAHTRTHTHSYMMSDASALTDSRHTGRGPATQRVRDGVTSFEAPEIRTGSGLTSPARDTARVHAFTPQTGAALAGGSVARERVSEDNGLRERRLADGAALLSIDVGGGKRGGRGGRPQLDDSGIAGAWYDPDEDSGKGGLVLDIEEEEDECGELDIEGGFGDEDADENGFDGSMSWGVSDTGTLKLGGFVAINERGIKEFRLRSQQRVDASSSPSKLGTTAKAPVSLQRTGNIKSELIMLDTLGRGASAVVQRALHLPALQLVAVKHMRLHDPEKRAQMASELKALYANMVPLVRRPGAAFGDTLLGTLPLDGTLESTLGGTSTLGMAGMPPILAAAAAAAAAGGKIPRPPAAANSRQVSASISGSNNTIPEDLAVEDDSVPALMPGSRLPPRQGMVSSLPMTTHALDGPPTLADSSAPSLGGADLSYVTEQLGGRTISGDTLGDTLGGGGTLTGMLESSTAEVDAAANPYIVKFYDAFANPSAGTVSIVMEFMGGGSLQDIVDAGGCQNEAVLARMAAHVFRGLHFLHRNRQLHRDIKPGNILVSTAGDQYKLADFGLATQLEGTLELAQTYVGTMAYMSPERLASGGEGYSFPADVWAAGLSLLSVAAGALPFPETGYWELVKYIRDDPPPLHVLMPPGPGPAKSPVASARPWRYPPSPEFRDFITQCLVKDPAKRPSAQTLLQHAFITRHIDDAQRLPAKAGAARGSRRGSADARALMEEIRDIDGEPLSADLSRALTADVGLSPSQVDGAIPGKFPTSFMHRSMEEQDKLMAVMHSVVTAVVDAHWPAFVQYFRRYRHKRRKKWYYSLDETSFNTFLAARVAAAGTLNSTALAPMIKAASGMHPPLAANAEAAPLVQAGSNDPQKSAGNGVPSAKELLLDLNDVRTLAAQLGLPPLLVRTAFNDAITKKVAMLAAPTTSAFGEASEDATGHATGPSSRMQSIRQRQADAVAQLQQRSTVQQQPSSLMVQAAELQRRQHMNGVPTGASADADDDTEVHPSLVIGTSTASRLLPTHGSLRVRADAARTQGSPPVINTSQPTPSAESAGSSSSGRRTIHVSVPASTTGSGRRYPLPSSGTSASSGTTEGGRAFSYPMSDAVSPPLPSVRVTAAETPSLLSPTTGRPSSGASTRLSRAGASVIGAPSGATTGAARIPDTPSASRVERVVAKLGNMEYSVDIPELPSASMASSRLSRASGSYASPASDASRPTVATPGTAHVRSTTGSSAAGMPLSTAFAGATPARGGYSK